VARQQRLCTLALHANRVLLLKVTTSPIAFH